MKLDNFVPFGRPQSGKVIIQVMTKFVVSIKLNTWTAIHKQLESKILRLTKIWMS